MQQSETVTKYFAIVYTLKFGCCVFVNQTVKQKTKILDFLDTINTYSSEEKHISLMVP